MNDEIPTDNRLRLLAETLVDLSQTASHADVMGVLRSSARRLSGADGIAIVLRDGDRCHYIDEDAIAPLWKGSRFPMAICISGWAMIHGETVIVPDITADERIPQDLYLATFVRSLVMVPMLGDEEAWGAIGAYWSDRHVARGDELHALEALARAAGAALRNLELLKSLREKQDRLEHEMAWVSQLQAISAAMIREDSPGALYQRIVDAAAALMHADAAALQEYVLPRDQLRLLASRGIHPDTAAGWEWVSAQSDSPCAKALRAGRRTIAGEAVLSGEAFRRSNLKAAQSTPLVSRSGRVLGMLSTHWHEPHPLSEEELGRFDVLARQAADLIERSQAEAALRDSERRLSDLANAMPQLVWTADATGRVDFYNERAQEYAGLEQNADGTWTWTPVLHADDREATIAVWARSVATGEPYQIEHRVAMADGSLRWHISRGIAARDEGGKVVRWYGTATDIHDLLTARENLRALNGDLERRVEERTTQLVQSQKMEAVGQLTGGVAHDFNNVLQGIGGCLSVLDPYVPDGRPRVLFEAAQQSIDRGARLTQSLLAFARRQRLAPQPTGLGTLLDGMRPLLERTLGGLIDVEMMVPAAAAPALVDSAQLEAAVLNLAINARDAMPGGGRLTFAVAERMVAAPGGSPDLAAGAYVTLSVTDTGTGMDAATLAHAFEPFFTTKDVGKGAGLGLAMVHGMAAQSGGGVQIVSAPGKGTTVTLFLPRAVPADTRPAKPVAETACGAGTVVLLVDDDAMVRAGVEAMLDSLGYGVVSADGGEAALDILHNGTAVDAVMTDYAMPGMNGAVLAQEVRALRPGLPVILITGYVDKPAGLEHAVVLSKPFRLADLGACLENALGTASVVSSQG